MHLGLSLGSISFPRYESKTLSELSPFAVYGATDLMGTGGDIIRLRAGSSEQDFTEAELYGSEYTTFVGSDTPYVVKLYDQAGSIDIKSDTEANQPEFIPSTKSVSFHNTDLLYSDEVSNSGNTAMGGNYTFASKFDQEYTGTTGHTQLISLYHASNGGVGFGYGSEHGFNRQQLEFQVTSSTPPSYNVMSRSGGGFDNADDKASLVNTSAPNLFGFETAIAKMAGTGTKSIFYKDATVTNTDTGGFGTQGESVNNRIGMNGWRVGTTERAFDGSLVIKTSIMFTRVLDDADTADLKNILGGL